jgi:hypothetical protein
MELHLPTCFPLYALVKDTFHGHFGISKCALPLGVFPINRGGDALSTLTLSHIQIPCMIWLSLSLPAK